MEAYALHSPILGLPSNRFHVVLWPLPFFTESETWARMIVGCDTCRRSVTRTIFMYPLLECFGFCAATGHVSCSQHSEGLLVSVLHF